MVKKRHHPEHSVHEHHAHHHTHPVEHHEHQEHHAESLEESHSHEKKAHHLEETLTKNIVELQKIHTDMAEKFDRLSKEISHLLALFELTARSFAKNAPVGEFEKDKEFLDKIDTLLDQNKTLAKGLVLMEERLREKLYGPSSAPASQSPGPARQQPQQKPENQEEFQPSMASANRPLPRF